MNPLMKKIKESVLSVFPIMIIVIVLNLVQLISLTLSEVVVFITACVLMVFGMGLFTLGTDSAMSPMGQYIGHGVIKSKKMWLLIVTSFLIGVFITIAEPDLSVLASQVPTDDTLFIIVVALGVGIMLVLSLLRIFLKISLRTMLVLFYALAFLLVVFVDPRFIPLSFDSGGVTTGPMTVPFIMAIGAGVAASLGGNHVKEDSFGFIAICSIGPIVAVLFMNLFASGDVTIDHTSMIEGNVDSISALFFHGSLPFLLDVLKSLLPIVIFFVIFEILFLKLPKNRMMKLGVGVLEAFLGLSIFLTAVNVGVAPIGARIGNQIAESSYTWILIPLGILFGMVVVLAEPAVHVLNKQVEEITGGTVTSKTMLISLAIGVGSSIGLAMIRILFPFSILWYLIPGYVISLALAFFVPKMYTAIAFDAGGVASGPLTAGFILPIAISASSVLALGNADQVLLSAFGVVAMVAMAPLLTVQIVGFIAYQKQKKKSHVWSQASSMPMGEDNEIIEFDF